MSRAVPSTQFGRFSQVFASRSLFEPQAIPGYCLCLIAILVIVATVTSGLFDYDPELFLNITASCSAVFLFAYAARWIGFGGIADPVEQIMLLYLTGLLLAFCSAIVASTAAPMADSLLHQTDMLLFGVDRVRLLAELNLGRDAIRFWAAVYNSLSVTPALAIALLVLTGKRQRAWALLTSFLAAALVSVVFIAILPAYGTPPFPYEFVEVFDGIRDGRLRTLDSSLVTGMSTFPSMHAAHATILACAFSWVGRWAAPLVILNILMIGSAVVVGGHYVIDVVAGAAIGFAILRGSLRLHQHIAASDPERHRSANAPVAHAAS